MQLPDRELLAHRRDAVLSRIAGALASAQASSACATSAPAASAPATSASAASAPATSVSAASAPAASAPALLAVSKTFPAEAVLALAASGQRDFGENYVQEALAKIAACEAAAPLLGLRWHFIGPIQSNKTRAIAEHFDWVHSIDRFKIAERLSAQRPASRGPLQCCIQVNLSGEASKSGVQARELVSLVHAAVELSGLRLRGLMVIPEAVSDPAMQRIPFARLRELLREINLQLKPDQAMDTLSMGMSADLEAAVTEGASWLRVGSAIFGARSARAGP
jgi:pyridoxal phosphate enzyme (YggS family)